MRAGLLALAVAVGATLAPAQPAPAFVDDVRLCLAANVPARSSAIDVEIRSRRPDSGEFTHEARIYWTHGDGEPRTLVCMTGPRELRDLAYLVHTRAEGESVWFYLPAEERVVRINPREAASRGRIARTAVRYEDLRYFPINLSPPQTDEVTESSFAGRKVREVRLTPPPGDDPVYGRIVASVDRETCVPLELRFYEPGGKLRKWVTADPTTLERHGDTWIARSLRLEDLSESSETHLTVKRSEIDTDLPERLFTPAYLARGHCAR